MGNSKKYKCKKMRVCFFFFFIFISQLSFSQDSITLKKDFYTVENSSFSDKPNKLHICKLTIHNLKKTGLITWINNNKVSVDNNEQIKKHFGAFYGDFNLYSFFYDVDNYELHDYVIVDFFLKLIKPGDRFSYFIVSETPFKEKCIEEYISVIPVGDIYTFLHPIPNRMLYPNDEIIIPNSVF